MNLSLIEIYFSTWSTNNIQLLVSDVFVPIALFWHLLHHTGHVCLYSLSVHFLDHFPKSYICWGIIYLQSNSPSKGFQFNEFWWKMIVMEPPPHGRYRLFPSPWYVLSPHPGPGTLLPHLISALRVLLNSCSVFLRLVLR